MWVKVTTLRLSFQCNSTVVSRHNSFSVEHSKNVIEYRKTGKWAHNHCKKYVVVLTT